MCSPTTLLHSTKHYSQMHTVHSNLTTFDACEPQLELWDLSPHFGEPQLEHWDLFPSTFEHTGSLLTQSRSSFAATKSIPPAIRAGARSGFSRLSRSRISARHYKLVARNTAVHLRAAAFARRSASRRIVLQYLLPSLTVDARLASSLTAGSTAGRAARGTRQ